MITLNCSIFQNVQHLDNAAPQILEIYGLEILNPHKKNVIHTIKQGSSQ